MSTKEKHRRSLRKADPLEKSGQAAISLGRWGESEFERWCHELQWVVNKSGDDRDGWDFYVTVPLEPLADEPLDRSQSQLNCLFQIKTIRETSQLNEGISLSNWRKLVEVPLAAFVLVLRTTDREQVLEAFLLHIDERQVAAVQKRLRTHSRGEVHKKTIRPPKRHLVKLSEPNGSALANKVAEALPDDRQKTYYERKLCWQKEAGLEAPYRFSFQFLNDDQARDELIEFALGVKRELNVSHLVYETDIRFGRAATTQRHDEGVVQFGERPSRPVFINLATNDGAYRLVMEGRLITPHFMVRDIPRGHDKARFIARGLELLIHWETSVQISLSYQGEPDEPRTLSVWRELMFPFLIFAEGLVRGGVTYELHDVGGTVVSTNAIPLEDVRGMPVRDDMVRFCRAIEGLEVASLLLGGDMTMTQAELETNLPVLSLLQRVAGTRDRPTLRLTLGPIANVAPNIKSGAIVALPFCDSLKIGGGELMVGGALIGTAIVSDEVIVVRVPECFMLALARGPNEEAKTAFRDALEEWVVRKDCVLVRFSELLHAPAETVSALLNEEISNEIEQDSD